MLQPYQEAGEESLRQAKAPTKTLGNVASLALGAGTQGLAFGVGQKIVGKLIPFFNQYIDPSTAVKGISKVNPKLGKFIKNAEKSGKSPGEIKEFLVEKFKEPIQSIQATAAEKHVIDKASEIGKLFQLAKKGKTQGNEFLRYAVSLMKSGDIDSEDTFSNFYKWWQSKPSSKRGSPRSEFELFRNEIGNTLRQSKAALHQEALNPPGSLPKQAPSAEQQAFTNQGQSSVGDQEILAALQKIMQM